MSAVTLTLSKEKTHEKSGKQTLNVLWNIKIRLEKLRWSLFWGRRDAVSLSQMRLPIDLERILKCFTAYCSATKMLLKAFIQMCP